MQKTARACAYGKTCATVVGFADHKALCKPATGRAVQMVSEAEPKGSEAGLRGSAGASKGSKEFFKKYLTMLRKQIKISPLCC